MKGKKTYIIVFMMLILLPNIVMLSSFENTYKKSENRGLSSFKIELLRDIKQNIVEFKNYYTDHYGLRLFLYNLYKNIVVSCFKESPSIEKVILGKEDWLFIGDFYEEAFSESKGTKIFNNAEMAVLNANIKEAKSWCKKRNIQFYLSVIPGKHTVYKEYLPYNFKTSLTKLDQIKSITNVIDIRKKLLKSKEKGLLYLKTDTHWNGRGAFIGYQEIMKALKKDYTALCILQNSDLEEVSYVEKQGDINNILGIKSIELMPVFKVKKSSSIILNDELEVPYYYKLSADAYEIRYKNLNAKNNLKVMFLRDSFGNRLKSYMSNSFKEVVLIYNHTFDKDVIKKEQPDVLVYEITERMVDVLLKIHTK